MFLISSIDKANGGVDPYFLFKGTLRSSRPIIRHIPSKSSLAAESEAVSSFLSTPTDVLEQTLNLYIAYEVASPGNKRKRDEMAAPYRFHLRDAADELIVCGRGLSSVLLYDQDLFLVVWGQEISLGFTSHEQLFTFLNNLRHVTVKPVSLADHPFASYLLPTTSHHTPTPTITIPTNTTTTPPMISPRGLITPAISTITGAGEETHTKGLLRVLVDAGSDVEAESPPPE